VSPEVIAAAFPWGKGAEAIMANDISVVSPRGRLDSVTTAIFERDLLENIDSGATRLLLDFSKLDYISSAGLRSVLLAAKRIRASGGRMSLCSLNRQIAEVFDISGFSSILDIQPSYDAAVTRLSAP
jgi:stage II sporulation protein AA (anti-sigma F factor antagonist)